MAHQEVSCRWDIQQQFVLDLCRDTIRPHLELCPFSKECPPDQLKRLNENVQQIDTFIHSLGAEPIKIEAFSALMRRISEGLNLVKIISGGLHGNFNELLRQFDDKKHSTELEKMRLCQYIFHGSDNRLIE